MESGFRVLGRPDADLLTAENGFFPRLGVEEPVKEIGF